MWHYLEKLLKTHKDSVIQVYGDEKKYTYLELLNEIVSIIDEPYLKKLKGAKCAILCRSSLETVKALLFCWRVGMIAIPLSLHYGKKHYDSIIKLTEPDILITDDLHLCKEYNNIMSFSLQEINLSNNKIIVDSALAETELMLCTSGTTGNPKAIMFTARAIKYNVYAISDYFKLNVNDTMLICRPLYHCAVLVGELLLSIYKGANILLYSGGYNPILIANILTTSDVTVMCGTPTLFKGVADCLKHRDKRVNLQMMAVSGEYLLPEYAKVIREVFCNTKIFNVYGLTEAGPRVSYLPYKKFDQNPCSVGIPLKGIEIKIVNERKEEISNGEVGKIWIKTPSIMQGYYKNERYANEKIDGEWFDTGDLGAKDEFDNLYILGRSDDMIIKAGMNIYPQEIEKRILKIEEIDKVLVYGKYNNGVEQIIAEVVLRENYKFIKAYNIMQKMLFVLPEYMMPTQTIIVEDLPRNASGKVVRPTKGMRKINDFM